jgi:hypothetical protein
MAFKEYRKFLAVGAGAGIEIGERDLTVTVVRVRPSGTRVVGTLLIERYAERPADERGREYAAFLKQHGASHLAAAVLLPRRDVIVRQIAMPGVEDKDLDAAVRFQLEGMHPYGEEEVAHDYARIAGTPNILLGIARREVIDRYVSMFAESGIKVATFTFSAAVLYSAARIYGAPPAPGFIAIGEHGSEIEVYGESEAKPIFSARFDVPDERSAARALTLALSELRLPVDTEPVAVSSLLPQPRVAPEGFEFEPAALPYATALTSACPHLSLRANLLPVESRAGASRLIYIPSIALAALLLLGLAGLFLYRNYEDRKYLDALHREIRRLDPLARKPMALERDAAIVRQRAELLDGFKRRTQSDLDTLNELTRLLAPPGWLLGAEIVRDGIRISGETEQAAGLLKVLDMSPLFEGSDFAQPIGRGAAGETFSIRSRREGILP